MAEPNPASRFSLDALLGIIREHRVPAILIGTIPGETRHLERDRIIARHPSAERCDYCYGGPKYPGRAAS